MKHDDPIRQALLDAAEEDLREALAALSGWGAPDPAPTPTGLSVFVQLGGTHGTVYTSERFTCVAENGSTLRYWYQNTGASTCTLQLYRVGLFRDELAEAPLTIGPGEDAVGLYKAPGNDTYYLRGRQRSLRERQPPRGPIRLVDRPTALRSFSVSASFDRNF